MEQRIDLFTGELMFEPFVRYNPGGFKPHLDKWKFIQDTLLIETDDCIWWPYNHHHGYAALGDKNVHRIICERVYGAPPTYKHESAHLCGNGQIGCINWKHLRWATHKENVIDSIKHGTYKLAKITPENVIEIRKLAGTMPNSKMALRFGIGERHIRRIISGKRWSWLKDEPDFNYPKSTLRGPDLFA
jgi:HNH endonuclease